MSIDPETNPRLLLMPEKEVEALRVFAHVNAEKATLYRAVMVAFALAKKRFALHLRPADVVAILGDGAPPVELAEVETALDQLRKWGNLEAHPDTADVATVDDFYRPRFLFQLTPAGEAAERALEVFSEELAKPGELKAAALADIGALLAELEELASAEPLDEGKAHRTLEALRARFDELTARAQTFIAGLQRTIDLHGISVADFLAYKELLIDYLERFIGDLILATHGIALSLGRLEEAGVEELLAKVARRELADAMNATEDDQRRSRMVWQERWAGLRGWFIGRPAAPSQAEILRARARAAIPALLGAVAAIHDRRVSRSDRVADLRTLAGWFAEADNETDAHRLWRAAFALSPARHLKIDAATLDARENEPVPPRTSWFDAPPIEILPRLRKTGRYVRRGQSGKVIDRTKEKALLALAAEAEARQIAAARRRLATGRRLRLGELGDLDPAEFGLFLDVLGAALAQRSQPGETVTASSSDGSVEILLEPTGDGREARLETSFGRFSGEDHFVTLTDLLQDVVEDKVAGQAASELPADRQATARMAAAVASASGASDQLPTRDAGDAQ